MEGKSHLLPQPQHRLFPGAEQAASKDVWDSKEHLQSCGWGRWVVSSGTPRDEAS